MWESDECAGTSSRRLPRVPGYGALRSGCDPQVHRLSNTSSSGRGQVCCTTRALLLPSALGHVSTGAERRPSERAREGQTGNFPPQGEAPSGPRKENAALPTAAVLLPPVSLLRVNRGLEADDPAPEDTSDDVIRAPTSQRLRHSLHVISSCRHVMSHVVARTQSSPAP